MHSPEEPARRVPGFTYAVERLFRLAFPKLTITAPAPGIRFERDVAVSVREVRSSA
jgi:hypothetical protein